MKSSPCKDCSDRYVGCHSKCDRYKAWSEAHERELEQTKKAKYADAMYMEHIIRTKNKTR